MFAGLTRAIRPFRLIRVFLFLAATTLPAQDDWKQYVAFTVRETAGLARENEPVEAQVRLATKAVRVMRWTAGKGEEVPSQIVDATPDGAAFKLRILFPATVAAKSSAQYRIYYGPADARPPEYPAKVAVRDETRVGWTVENDHYVADATMRTVQDKPEDSGQVRALTLKFAGITLLRSSGPRMHWAPNYQRKGARGYTGAARWEPVQKVEKTKGPLLVTSRRTGFNADYPEIALDATYKFFASVPYFLFRSEMRMTQPIDLFLLRNDEMTMDAFFTHVAWPGAKGPQTATLDEREKILEKNPIPYDAPWVCFYNQDKGYGFGSVRLAVDTRNTAGGQSPMYKPYTKISDGVQNGRYWARRFIHERETHVPAGSRYVEENAYVIFRTLPEFLEWEKKLRKPLVVSMVTTEPSKAAKAAAKAASRQ